jgi:hypothetical protein
VERGGDQQYEVESNVGQVSLVVAVQFLVRAGRRWVVVRRINIDPVPQRPETDNVIRGAGFGWRSGRVAP